MSFQRLGPGWAALASRKPLSQCHLAATGRPQGLPESRPLEQTLWGPWHPSLWPWTRWDGTCSANSAQRAPGTVCGVPTQALPPAVRTLFAGPTSGRQPLLTPQGPPAHPPGRTWPPTEGGSPQSRGRVTLVLQRPRALQAHAAREAHVAAVHAARGHPGCHSGRCPPHCPCTALGTGFPLSRGARHP